MKRSFVKTALALAVVPLVSGCVNNDYDLSDIDTTSRINVENLVVPVNLDAVTLGDIITFDENSKIKPVTLDGKTFYALIEDGTFESETIHINKVTASAPTIEPTEAYLPMIDLPLPAQGTERATASLTYRITPMGEGINYDAGVIDEAIVSLEHITAPLSLTITLDALNAGAGIVGTEFNDVVVNLPKGLEVSSADGSYDPETGIWTIDNVQSDGTHAALTLNATGVDCVRAGAVIDADHSFCFNGPFTLQSGTVTLKTNIDLSNLPQELHFRATYNVSTLEATAFSGIVNYKLDGLNIDPVSLGDIPDFLRCDGTNISLNNPQIYLNVNNPVASNGLDCTSGITLSAIRPNVAPMDFTPDNGAFTIGHQYGNDGPYNFVLAPEDDNLNVPEQYAANRTFVQFTSLRDLLSISSINTTQAGLPEKIGIRLDDPQIPAQHVVNFALGRDIDPVRGSYELVAPLSLTSTASIIYTETEDGWNDEDVDAITVTQLKLTAVATNNCPVGVELYVWPVDVDGNRIPGVEVKSNYLEANASQAPITIELTGTVQHLDGVIYEARLGGSDNSEALDPAQTVELKDIRVCVSGYYEKEL